MLHRGFELLNAALTWCGNLLNAPGWEKIDPVLSVIVSVVTLGSLAAGAALHRWRQQKPIDQLYRALIEHSIASKSELIYQIKSYVPPDLLRRTNPSAGNAPESGSADIRQLLRQIKASSGEKKSSGAVFSIVGAPACGKTTTMRYLFCQLSKSRKCVYFQMQDVADLEQLSHYLGRQKAENHFPDSTCVVAFFDGLDEASKFFRIEDAPSMEETFRALFFQGDESRIHGVFRDNNLSLDCIVVSLRPEFLEHSIQKLSTLQHRSVYSKVYQIQPMSDRDVLKIFRSLRMLKRLEARRKEEAQRHQERCPPRKEMRRYTRLLRNILQANPNCLFRYPMYIRYAYPFMREYEAREAAGETLRFSPNIAVSFDILLTAILKWEFHIYYENESVKTSPEKWERFQTRMKGCARAVVLHLLNAHAYKLRKADFHRIVQKFFPEEVSRLAMAHCFMTSGDTGEEFEFCHRTFYEYFLAGYLLDDADYPQRKEHLLPVAAADLRAMYCSLLCLNGGLNRKISDSTTYITGLMMPGSYLALLRMEKVGVSDDPALSMVEILEYLPCIQCFQYRERDYTRDDLEALMDTGRLDLQGTGWESLGYARALIPPERVNSLNINGLPLEDVSALGDYRSLQYLEMQFEDETAPILEQIFRGLEPLSLHSIHFCSGEGSLCQQAYDRIQAQTLRVNLIYVKTPGYSQAHLTMFRLNRQWEQSGQPARFYPSVRSDLGQAKGIYHSKHADKDPQMLEAVFELEAKEGGLLGLQAGSSPDATYWNGLSLAAYQKYKDSIDEKKLTLDICVRLEPYVARDDSEYSVTFGALYGETLIFHSNYSAAALWLTNSYRNGGAWLSQKKLLQCGVRAYKAHVRAGEKDLAALVQELEEKFRQLDDTCTWEYTLFTKYLCAEQLSRWTKGQPEPAGLQDALARFQTAAAALYERYDNIYLIFEAIYFACVRANRNEDLEEGARQLEELTPALERIQERPNADPRDAQAAWIQYQEQALYHYLLEEDGEHILPLVEQLLDYPYRRGELPLRKFRQIQSTYQSCNTSSPDLDRHQLWTNLWY